MLQGKYTVIQNHEIRKKGGKKKGREFPSGPARCMGVVFWGTLVMGSKGGKKKNAIRCWGEGESVLTGSETKAPFWSLNGLSFDERSTWGTEAQTAHMVDEYFYSARNTSS